MSLSPKNRLAIVLFCLLAASAAFGQNAAPELNITLGEQRVKFAPTRSFQEMRLEVVNNAGEIVFTHFTTEAEFDWNLRAGNSEALTPGLYRYALTLKFSEDLSRQHTGHFIVEKGQDQIWLTANEGAEVSGAALTNARSGGRSLAGFRTSDDKTVKRDLSGRPMTDAEPDKPSEASVRLAPTIGGMGTSGRIAKWIDNSGNLGDSLLSESAGTVTLNGKLSGVYSVNAPVTDRAYFLQSNASGAGSGFFVNNDTWLNSTSTFSTPLAINFESAIRHGAVGGAGAGVITNAVNFAIDNQVFNGALITNSFGLKIGSLAGTNKWGIFDESGSNWYASGNLGIGTTAPAAKLDVLGDIRSALRQELTVLTPNVINGFMGTGSGGVTPGNRVTAGVVGASIGGGGFNGTLSGIGNGDNTNRVTDSFGTVGGGFGNRAGDDAGTLYDAFAATVGGGFQNIASGDTSTVGGGHANTASGFFATVGGGNRNIASAEGATVPGGGGNTASGNYSFAAGRGAKANHQGAFVWADSTAASFASTVNNQFLIRAAGGVGIGVNNPSSPLTVAGDVKSISGVIRATDSAVITSMFSNAGFLAGYVGTESLHNLVLRTNGLDRMIFDTAGNVGIGTPGLPTRGRLEVNGLGGNVTVAGFFMDSSTVGPYPSQSLPFSVFADNGIAGSVFIAFSDARIKRIHGQSDAARDLATLAGIKVTDYSYIDTVSKGTGRQKKVIAQQVEEVFPQAVTRSTDVVPDIYQKAAAKDGWVTLTTNLKQGERVRLISADEEGVYEVLEAEPNRFRTAFVAKGAEVFVYGREVKDFRSVDYEAISMLNVSATQELNRLMGQKDAEIKALAARLTKLEAVKAENEALAERLAGLEQMLQQLTQQTPKSQTKQQ